MLAPPVGNDEEDTADLRLVATAAEAVFDGVLLSTFVASTGRTVQIQRMHVENRWRLVFGSLVDLRIYRSTNNIISSADYLVWSGGWSRDGAESVP